MSLLNTSQFGKPGGVAQLDDAGLLTAAQVPALTADDVGLGNVDNTADVHKPISDEVMEFLYGIRPTDCVGETIPAYSAQATTVSTGSSGRLYLMPMRLPAGPVNKLKLYGGATAGAGLTHCWCALLSATRMLLGITADDTTAAWPINTPRTLTFAAPVVIPTRGTYIVGRLITHSGGTMPSLNGSLTSDQINNQAPVQWGGSTVGLTDPASLVTALAGGAAGAPASIAGRPYVTAFS